VLVASALAIAVFFVFGGALGLYFAQEDFRGLAVAKGLLPRHASLWRYVSVQGFMDLFYPLFGTHPKPYHFVSIALHAANAALLFSLLARRLAPVAAMVAAGFFAAHPVLFTAIYWQSARSDILATTFGLCTVVLALRRGRERWLAVPSFALAVLSKESVVFLPLALWLIRRWARKADPGDGAIRDLLIPALCLLSGGYGLYLLLGKAGITVGTGPNAAYALDFGMPLLQNLMTYVGWTIDVTMRPSALGFVDVRNPDIFGLAIGSLIAWGVAALLPGLRTRGWLAAGATFLLLLVPVLPLRNHTYHYFLYAPLAAASWCLGAVVDLAMAPRAPRRTKGSRRPGGERTEGTVSEKVARGKFAAWLVAGACLVLLTWNGARLVRRMETRPLVALPGLRGDPIVDRSIIARNALDGLQGAQLPQGVEITFLFRDRLALLARIALGSGEAPAPGEEVYVERNLRTAVFDGYGVRAMIPQVAKVAFALEPPPASSRSLYAVYAPTGETEVFSRVGLDSLMRSPWVNQW